MTEVSCRICKKFSCVGAKAYIDMNDAGRYSSRASRNDAEGISCPLLPSGSGLLSDGG